MLKSLLAFVIALLMGFGQAANVATASSNIDGEEIRAFDFGYNGAPQGDRQSGPYSVVFTNTQSPITDPYGFHEIIFVRLGAGHQRASKAQIIVQLDLVLAAFGRGENPICPTCFFDYVAGAAFGGPGTTTTSVGPDFMTPGPVLLLRGRYAYLCAIPELDGTPHYKLGMLGTFWAK